MILNYIWFGIFSLAFPFALRLFYSSADEDDALLAFFGLIATAISGYSAVAISCDFVTAPLFSMLLDFLPDTGSFVNACTAFLICIFAWVAYAAILFVAVDLVVSRFPRKRAYQIKLTSEANKQLFWVLAKVGGGIYKRIDENRELVELLQKEAPEFVYENPWVMGWLKSQDDFLCKIEAATSEPPVCQFGKRNIGRVFPRSWPSVSTDWTE